MYFLPFFSVDSLQNDARKSIIGLLKSFANVNFVLVKRCHLNLDLHCRVLLKCRARSGEGLSAVIYLELDTQACSL